MKAILTGGGSAGHVTPLLAVASEIEKHSPNSELIYVGQRGDRRFDGLVAKEPAIAQIRTVYAGKWRRYHGAGWRSHFDPETLLLNVRDMILIGVGFIQSLWLMLRVRPQVVFVKGGFVGLPIGLAAALCRIPIVTHDSDALPGLTNRVLSRFARRLAVGQPSEHYPRYDATKLVYTGNPVREVFFQLQEPNIYRAKFGIPVDAPVIAVVGGSLGAIRMNNGVLANLEDLVTDLHLYVLWLTGKPQFEELAHAVEQLGLPAGRVLMWDFTESLEELIGAADVVVSRTGASSIAELAAARKPLVAIPNPYLTGGHQTKNAMVLEDHRAAVVISEKELASDPGVLRVSIEELLTDEKARRSLGDALGALSVRDASSRLANTIIEAAGT